MTKTIQIAKDFEIPLSMMQNTISAMGGRGGGKSYLTMKIEEQVLEAGGWLVIFDPVGIHYGLRLDKTGKKPSGLDVPVFGGLRGDLPLAAEAGTFMADLVCDRRLSVVLDVSQFSDSELNRFSTDFCNRFFERMKGKPRAVTIVLEECQEFVPQNPQKGEEKKLHILTRISKIGRNYGIGMMLISQRPQEINKKVLNLTELMFAFRMTGTHERKSMAEWFTYQNYDGKIAAQLPALEVGQPFVMSPSVLRINKQIKVLPKRTFDASATPEFNEVAETIALKPIDLSMIKDAMSQVVDEAKANDPKILRHRITELERMLSGQKTETRVERVEVPVFKAGELERAEKMITKLEGMSKEERGLAISLAEIAGTIGKAVDIAKGLQREPVIRKQQNLAAPATGFPAIRPMIQNLRNVPVESNGDLTGPEQKILDALAWFESIGSHTPLKNAVAALSGYATSGTFAGYLSGLRTAGLIDYTRPGTVSLTDAGRAKASRVSAPLTVDAMQNQVMSILSGPDRTILNVLIRQYPDEMPRDELARAAGYEQSGTFAGYLSGLKTKGMIDYPRKNHVRAMPFLFLET